MSKFIALFLFCIIACMSFVMAQDTAAPAVPKACDICKSSCALIKIDAAKERCNTFCEKKVCSLKGKLPFEDEVEADQEFRVLPPETRFDVEESTEEMSEWFFFKGGKKPIKGGKKPIKGGKKPIKGGKKPIKTGHEGHKHTGALGIKCRICEKACDKSKTEEGKAKCKSFCSARVCAKEQKQEVKPAVIKPAVMPKKVATPEVVEPAADIEVLSEGYKNLPCEACKAGACDLIKNEYAKFACKLACAQCKDAAATEAATEAEAKYTASFADAEEEEEADAEVMSEADLKLIKLPCTLCKRGACKLVKDEKKKARCEATCKKLKFCSKKPGDKKKGDKKKPKKFGKKPKKPVVEKKPVEEKPVETPVVEPTEAEADAEIDWSAVKTKVKGFVDKNKCNLCNLGCKLIRKDEWKSKCESYCSNVCGGAKEEPTPAPVQPEENAPAADEPIFG